MISREKLREIMENMKLDCSEAFTKINEISIHDNTLDELLSRIDQYLKEQKNVVLTGSEDGVKK